MSTLGQSVSISSDWQMDEGDTKPTSLVVQLRRSAYVLPWFRFVYAGGDDARIQIAFASHLVAVTGHGLAPLLAAVSTQRVVRVIQPTTNEANFGVRGNGTTNTREPVSRASPSSNSSRNGAGMYYGQLNSWSDCGATEGRLKADWMATDKRLKGDKNSSFSGLGKIQAEGLYMVSLLSSVGVPVIASGVISRRGEADARCSERTRDLAIQGERDATGRQGRPYRRIGQLREPIARQIRRTSDLTNGVHPTGTHQIESTSCYGRKAFEE